MNCEVCNKVLVGLQRKFCSKSCKGKDSNVKYQNYQSQQKRGLTRKIQLAESLGGKCSKCGYCKNLAALEFHHKDPFTKKWNIDIRKCSNATMESLVEESKKCELLCSNCHAEHHNPTLNEWER